MVKRRHRTTNLTPLRPLNFRQPGMRQQCVPFANRFTDVVGFQQVLAKGFAPSGFVPISLIDFRCCLICSSHRFPALGRVHLVPSWIVSFQRSAFPRSEFLVLSSRFCVDWQFLTGHYLRFRSLSRFAAIEFALYMILAQ
jgi:hypothetical protein